MVQFYKLTPQGKPVTKKEFDDHLKKAAKTPKPRKKQREE